MIGNEYSKKKTKALSTKQRSEHTYLSNNKACNNEQIIETERIIVLTKLRGSDIRQRSHLKIEATKNCS